jgi:hypothetical protein
MNMRTTAILAGVLTTAATVQAAIVITEVAPKGSTGQCEGEDWIEIHNDGDAAVDLAGYKLHDNKGVGDAATFTFPASFPIAADEFKVLCGDATGSFQFGIGDDDQVTLLDASGTAVDTTGVMPGVDFDDANDVPIFTWARVDDDGEFAMLRYPSPGASNEDMQPAKFQVFINEVADKGTDMNPGFACDPAADYIELYNAEPGPIDITGWKIHDDDGADGADAYIHASNHTTTSIPSKGFLLLCGEDKSVDLPTFQDFKFGIGSDDAITLIDAAGNVIDTTGTLTKRGDATTVWGRTEDGGGVFTYLTPPTPGATNVGMDYKPAGDADAMAAPGTSTVVLNEIADKGSGADTCDGEDWVELYNYGSEAVDIGGFHLADEKGVLHEDVHIFPDDDAHVMQPYSFMLLCKETHFQFGIGGSDTVILLNAEKQVLDKIVLTDEGSETKTMQRVFDGTGDWAYSESPAPSPGLSNCEGGCPLPKKDDDSVSGGVIAGAVLGTVAGVAVLGLIAKQVSAVSKETVPKKPDRGFIDVNNV